ncbi:MAG: asparagine--tRNA ligase [Ignavibacteriaceae bacterium]|nr:asparagine--tRNA ligase [Ignavibacteriaceae bacterium]
MAKTKISNLSVKNILNSSAEFEGKEVSISGWVRTSRSSKTFGFIELNDGSCFKNIQVVYDDKISNFDEIEKVSLGSSLSVTGLIVKSPGEKQAVELNATKISVIGAASPENPIQKKRHSFEFLRTIAHLRPRTNTYMAVFRVRSIISHAIHKFFQEQGFVYIHTPIITSSDAEGAGDMFRVSTLDPNNPPRTDDKKIDFSQELLGKPSFLTVSGQLTVEPFCFAFRNVYTFGPTFRAENSNTARHANEFWMIEPEIAFAGLEEDMSLAEDMMKYIINSVLNEAPDEMEFFNKLIDTELLSRLDNLIKSDFEIITYTEAVNLLKKSGESFEYPVEWGENLQTEHERYITEKIFNKPVFVIDYPKDIKAFYMKLNDDGKTVRAMDLLVPGVGEIIGGSQREERFDVLEAKMKALGIDPHEYDWYQDVRRFGTFPHAGFGLGLERAVMYLTGMKNIRDVIPYPRTPNNLLF